MRIETDVTRAVNAYLEARTFLTLRETLGIRIGPPNISEIDLAPLAEAVREAWTADWQCSEEMTAESLLASLDAAARATVGETALAVFQDSLQRRGTDE